DTLYFGGGTPSVLGTKRLTEILKAIKEMFNVDKNAEITMEVNPTSSNNLNFSVLKEYGLNRLSVGMQSAVESEMKLLGRTHTREDVIYTVRNAQKCGISNISLDLIIGVPQQTKTSLKKSMDFCADLNVKHISAYILKIEEGTKFYEIQDSLDLPNEDIQAEQYLFVSKYLEKLGYNQYEISNYSLEGYESRHNNKYWRCMEYIGIGPSAHSFYKGERYYYNRSFEDFYNNKKIYDGKGGTEEEFIMLNLRLKRGLIFKEFEEKYGHKISDRFLRKAELFKKTGYMTLDKEKASLTREGYLVSNAIISELI
ncbi:MAG: radical SAM family heme chaperone HemW, partial [Ruminococcus sp.]